MTRRVPRAQRRVERMVAAGDRAMRAGDVPRAREIFLSAACLQEEVIDELTDTRHLGTLSCGCVLLFRFAGEPVRARRAAERFLAAKLDEPAEGWLMDQLSELTLGSHAAAPAAGGRRSAMVELIRLRAGLTPAG